MKASKKEAMYICINLLKSIIGSGILKYPCLYKEFGVYPCLCLTFISSICSFAGVILYIELNDKYNCGYTLSTVSNNFAPAYFKILADIVVIFKCYTVALAYLVYIKEQINFLISYYNIPCTFEVFLFTIVCAISPFIFINKLDKLKHTSSAGMFAVFLLVCTSVFRYFTMKTSTIFLDTGNRSYTKFFSYFVFSFTCHQNIFTIQNEMYYYNKNILKYCVFISFLLAAIIYSIFGFISYMAFGTSISLSFIETHPNDNIKMFLSVFYILLLAFSIPLQTNPCKKYFLNIFNENFSKNGKHKLIQFATGVGILLSLYLLALTNIDFDALCKFIGGTFSTIMCFIFASGFYFMSFGLRGKCVNSLLGAINMTFGLLTAYSLIRS